MFETLGERQKDFEFDYDFYLTKRLPVVIRVDGINFSKLTEHLPKPSEDFIHCMATTMMYAIKEMQGAVFGYAQSDEITFILRNDQSLESEAWLQNRIQKIVSRVASLVTKGFQLSQETLAQPLDLVGDSLFDVRVFIVPNLTEAVNNLIWRQQDCSKNAVMMSALTHLTDKLGRKAAQKLMYGKNSEEQLKLLKKECNIDFEESCSLSFRQGVAAYRVPVLHGESFKKKWALNFEPPLFVENQDFLYNILINGVDIFRSNQK